MKNTTLYCWKFIAALCVMANHASYGFTNGSYPFLGAYVFVEFFFMVSGYYLVLGLETGKIQNVKEYMKKRWGQFFPYTTIVIVITYIWIGIMTESLKGRIKSLMRLPLEIMLLSNLHLTYTAVGWLWYIAAILFITPFLCYLFLRHKELFQMLVWAVPIIWYGYCFSNYGYLLVERNMLNDLVRAGANLLLGGSIFYIARNASGRKIKKITTFFITIISWGLFIVTIILAYRLHKSEYDFYCIFMLFFALILIESGWAADIKWSKLNVLSKLSMGLYIVHGFVQKVIVKYPVNATIREQYILCYAASFICAIILLKAGERVSKLYMKYK